MALDILSNLPNECKDLSPYLSQKISDQLATPRTEFRKFISVYKAYAEEKNRLFEFTDVKIPMISKMQKAWGSKWSGG